MARDHPFYWVRWRDPSICLQLITPSFWNAGYSTYPKCPKESSCPPVYSLILATQLVDTIIDHFTKQVDFTTPLVIQSPNIFNTSQWPLNSCRHPATSTSKPSKQIIEIIGLDALWNNFDYPTTFIKLPVSRAKLAISSATNCCITTALALRRSLETSPHHNRGNIPGEIHVRITSRGTTPVLSSFAFRTASCNRVPGWY